MHVQPGALHRANGGFLLVEALELLQQEASWAALKRALREGRVRIESLSDIRERAQTMAIAPEPIALDVKVVLFGEPWVFARLRSLDPDFVELFKVQAEFSNTTERNDVHCLALLRGVAAMSRCDRTRHLDRTGAARLIDEASRMAGDAERISVRIGRIYDLVREANAYAADSNRLLIASWDIERALAAKEDRAGRMKALEQDLIKRRLIFIETDGAKTGAGECAHCDGCRRQQVRCAGADYRKCRPGVWSRGVLIERLAHYTGLSHKRGAQTLGGFLNMIYAPFVPLSLLASVAFEQCYGPIDGDSASAAELIAILSAIADVPVAQGIGITGSIDQHGAMQPVGSINLKIEGFFDVCAMRGLSPGHGVIIPKANVVNLMLREDVAEAARRATFAIHAVDTVGEAIEVLTGMVAGNHAARGCARQLPSGWWWNSSLNSHGPVFAANATRSLVVAFQKRHNCGRRRQSLGRSRTRHDHQEHSCATDPAASAMGLCWQVPSARLSLSRRMCGLCSCGLIRRRPCRFSGTKWCRRWPRRLSRSRAMWRMQRLPPRRQL